MLPSSFVNKGYMFLLVLYFFQVVEIFVLFIELVPLCFTMCNSSSCFFLETIFASSFLTQSIPTFVASLKFDLNFSCSWLSLISKSFSLFCFCLALFLAKIIVDALISILIISQNRPLSLRLQYLEMTSGIVNRGDWLGNPANFKGLGYCSILSRSRDNDPAHRNPKWRRSRGLMYRLVFGFHAIKL